MTTAPTWSPGSDLAAVGSHLVEPVNARYTLLSYVGHGGMSVVFRARDRLTNAIVALKRMAGSRDDHVIDARTIGTDRESRSRLTLAREFRTLATLRHPNVVSVLDYGFAVSGDPFFTMELIDHPRSVLEAARSVAVPHKVEMLVQLLRALSYLHRRGVIHRDLKPSNVLVDDRVRLLDFGIAVHRGERAHALGTISHIAPEVLEDEPPTEAADLYAVGVIAYQMLAGQHPFSGFIGEAFRLAVLALEPDLGRLTASPALAAVVGRLLAKQPAARYASADDAIDALIGAAGLDVPRQTRDTRESFLQAATFVDRPEARGALVAAVAHLRFARGRMWLVEGESGIGKSRLLEEIRTLALVAGVRVIRTQADSDARGAFDLWREPLRHLLLSTPIDDTEASILAALVPDIEHLLERAVAHLPVKPQTARALMLGTIVAMLERQTTPVVLVLEDLHRAGEGLDLLRALTPRLPTLPVLIIGSFRGEEAQGLAHSIPDASCLRLGPLARDDIATLLESMLGRADVRVVDFLDRHTEGNVFFLVEAVRALADDAGSLEQVGRRPLPERLVSDGIQSVIARRLGTLPAGVFAVLRWSAVVGRVLDQVLLEETFGVAGVGEVLAVGAATRVLEVSDNQFRFAHDKFREHLLDALEPVHRRQLHGEVAAAIERVHGIGQPWTAALAHHHHEAEQPDRAARFSALAGQAALEQGAYGDATRLLARAIAGYEASPADHGSYELDALLHYAAVRGATQGWSAPELKGVYARVIVRSAELGTDERMIPALHGLAISAFSSGDFASTRTIALRYATLAEESGDVIGRIEAALMLANVAKWLGHHADAETYHQQVIVLYEPAQLPIHQARYGWNPRVVVAFSHAVSTCIRGEPDRAVQIYREAIAMAERTAHPFMIAIALQIGAWVHHLRRDVPETLHYAEALVELSGTHGFPEFRSLGDAFAGWAMTHAGRVEPGLERLRVAMTVEQRMGLATTLLLSLLADAYIAAGAVNDALDVLQSILEADATTQERCYHPELYRLLGEVWAAKGERPKAEAALASARELAVAQGARLFGDRCGKVGLATQRS